MAFVFAIIGLSIQIVFLFKREWLFEKRSFTLIFIFSALMFVMSYILMLNHVGNPELVRMLTIPLLAASMFYIINQVFLKLKGRNPEDTFGSIDISLMGDGIFNAIFWFSSTVLSVLLSYLVLP